MTCPEATSDPLKATGWVDFILIQVGAPSAVRNESKNGMNTMETYKEKVMTEKVQPPIEEYKPNPRSNRHSKFQKNEVRPIRC
jgi:hypothetical protein